MFERSRPYRYINKEKVEGQIFHLLTFKVNERQVIMVRVEEFTDHPFAFIKFYDRDHRWSKKTLYNRLTRKGNLPIIMRTCIEIMLDFYHKNSAMSFGFVGAPTLEEKEAKKREETKRSRVYRRAMERFFNPMSFLHTSLEEHSLYMMLNRAYCAARPENQGEMLHCIKNAYPRDPCWVDMGI